MEMLYLSLGITIGLVIGVSITMRYNYSKVMARERIDLLEAGICMSGQRLLDIARPLPDNSAKICVILCAEQLKLFCELIEAQAKKELL